MSASSNGQKYHTNASLIILVAARGFVKNNTRESIKPLPQARVGQPRVHAITNSVADVYYWSTLSAMAGTLLLFVLKAALNHAQTRGVFKPS